MQKPYGKLDWSYAQGEEWRREDSEPNVEISEYVQLNKYFQFPFPQKSYIKPKDGETSLFLFIIMFSLSSYTFLISLTKLPPKEWNGPF